MQSWGCAFVDCNLQTVGAGLHHRWPNTPLHIEQFRIVLSIFKVSAPTIQCACASTVQAQKGSQGGGGAPAEAARQWRAARDDYKASAEVFQRSRNLSGAIFASSNAALVSAQLGDDSAALKVLPPPPP